ncbi:hypothetical protein BJF79_44200 [Actinomadura sp. CNU-125]|uniref:barstar family protein n=1 Tax=Actinomadura sp. CNU-125 TaxID=1904961 RepID=UPI000965C9DB|nr:barstar family protein [Actinomadura sp. CNU-125]OLT25479.1 hypothetical protein BJF79_44200 [Actinomadura sp. CNU-125]
MADAPHAGGDRRHGLDRTGRRGRLARLPPGRTPRCDSDGFLRLCRETLEFPEGVGVTWDALESALTDLSWAPAEHGYVVLYETWSELAEDDQPAFRAVLDLFAGAVKRRRDTATPMTVLLSSVGVEVAGVPRLA